MYNLGKTRILNRIVTVSLRSFHPLRHLMLNKQVKESIELNATEQKIKHLLVNFSDFYNQTAQGEKLELRITGGWVRDKLLGQESHDLDVAVNLLTGEEFATKLLEYAKENNLNPGQGAGLHTIKKNPEKSKHLETCTTKLYGLDIDFVNLRSEQYTEGSRVPLIECGTAEEDSLRRDATLNALFYNLNEDKVEDFTGMGLTDLQNGILRTPLQPLQTFLDDPLRVLRLIRFACRFNFVIEAETLLAMKDERMRSTLIHKISRERVGVEMEKILTSDNVQYGLRLMNHVSLTDSIFNAGVLWETICTINEQNVLDEVEACREMVPRRIATATQVFDGFYQHVRASDAPLFREMVERIISKKTTQKLFWLCTVLQPYGLVAVKVNPKKLSATLYAEVVLKEGLRLGKHDYDPASSIIDKSVTSTTLERFFSSPDSVPRSELGLYIREFNDFEVNLVFNAFNDLLQVTEVSVRNQVPTPHERGNHVSSAQLQAITAKYEALLVSVAEQNLGGVAQMKPIVDGKVLSRTLQRKPGPWMREITSEVLRWQLDNPEGTAEQCIERVREFLKTSV